MSVQVSVESLSKCSWNGCPNARGIRKHGAEELYRWTFYGCDLDGICARMTAIQLAANCAVHRVEIGEILIVQGNTLASAENKQVILHASSPKRLALA